MMNTILAMGLDFRNFLAFFVMPDVAKCFMFSFAEWRSSRCIYITYMDVTISTLIDAEGATYRFLVPRVLAVQVVSKRVYEGIRVLVPHGRHHEDRRIITEQGYFLM